MSKFEVDDIVEIKDTKIKGQLVVGRIVKVYPDLNIYVVDSGYDEYYRHEDQLILYSENIKKKLI